MMWSSTTVHVMGERTYSLKVRLTSPTSSTSVPFTERAAGNATTRPPGQWAIVPGPEVTPDDPAHIAPVREIVRSVPAADVTCIVVAKPSAVAARSTTAWRPGSLGIRSKTSGCSLEIISTRAPPARIAPSSGAWSSPSTVQSATKSAAEQAAIVALFPATAIDAPVDRIGTGPRFAGVVASTTTTAAPTDASARRLVSTSDGRLARSHTTTAVSPAPTPQAANCSAKRCIHDHSVSRVMPEPRFRRSSRTARDVRGTPRRSTAASSRHIGRRDTAARAARV